MPVRRLKPLSITVPALAQPPMGAVATGCLSAGPKGPSFSFEPTVCFPELPVSNGPMNQAVNKEELEEPGEGSEDEWEQVGPRNKTAVTRQAHFVQTPITGIFGGHIRSPLFWSN